MMIHVKAAGRDEGVLALIICMCLMNPKTKYSTFLKDSLWKTEQHCEEAKQASESRGEEKAGLERMVWSHLCVCERYLYVGNYICGEECVAELGNRS